MLYVTISASELTDGDFNTQPLAISPSSCLKLSAPSTTVMLCVHYYYLFCIYVGLCSCKPWSMKHVFRVRQKWLIFTLILLCLYIPAILYCIAKSLLIINTISSNNSSSTSTSQVSLIKTVPSKPSYLSTPTSSIRSFNMQFTTVFALLALIAPLSVLAIPQAACVPAVCDSCVANCVHTSPDSDSLTACRMSPKSF